jgi:predicted RNA-binding protein YlqC (UPF0109 family)
MSDAQPSDAQPSDAQPSDSRSLAEFLVRRLVDEPDAVVVTEEIAKGERVLRVTVAETDRGKVIGRQGRIVRALRTVVRASGVRTNERVTLELEQE